MPGILGVSRVSNFVLESITLDKRTLFWKVILVTSAVRFLFFDFVRFCVLTFLILSDVLRFDIFDFVLPFRTHSMTLQL